MKKISHKNYLIFILIIIFTVLITLYLSYIYSDKTTELSKVYKNSNIITYKDFDVYISENSNTIIYIGDKTDLSYKEFDNELLNIIESKNLNDYFVYIDANSKIINKINRDYQLLLSIKDIPYIIVLSDSKIAEYKKIEHNSNAKTIINYGVFE